MESPSIADRIQEMNDRIQAACQRAGRSTSDVNLMLVSKTVERERVDLAIAAGHRLFGENRVQELVGKFAPQEPSGAKVHLIGHLQTNKVNAVLPYAAAIHSIDRVSLVEAIEKRHEGEPLPVYLQVNTSQEESKFGVHPDDTVALAERIIASPQLQLVGLMTIALFDASIERVRPCFVLLRNLRDDLERRELGKGLGLSMGMSSDFEAAIEEGSTLVRVGSRVFGVRPTKDTDYWPPS